MADTHNRIQYGTDIAKGVGTAAGLDLSYTGLERIGETLTPIIDVWTQPEWAVLRNDNLGAIFRNSAAVAAEFSFSGIGLPAGSTNLLIVEAITVRSGASTVQLGFATRTAIAATGTDTLADHVANRDQRYGSPFNSKTLPIEVWNGTDPASVITNSVLEEVVTTATTYSAFQVGLPAIVRAGGVIVVVGQTVNQSVQANYKFHIRAGLPGELTPV